MRGWKVDRDRMASAIKEIAPGAGIAGDMRASGLTSLRIGGPVDLLVRPDSPEEAAAIVGLLRGMDLGCMALGGGTNLLVRDGGIRGAVLHTASLEGMEQVEDKGSSVVLSVGAGLRLSSLLGHARREGLSGIEGLAGIPGLVGGAIAGNAGSYGSEMMDVVSEVSLIGQDGRVVTLGRGDFTPGYRDSGLPGGSVIVGARLLLRRDEPAQVAARMDEALRKKNQTQPLGQRSAGCVFKNPVGDSAGRLIDAAGCKGMSQGPITVSEVHAGFFINRGGGTASDFMRLMDMVSARVREAFDIHLEPEIKVVGSDT